MAKSSAVSVFFGFINLFTFIKSFTPYTPAAGITYYIEANREGVWPNCPYRFLSYGDSCTGSADLWKGAGKNQEFTLESAGDGLFYLKASCGSYLSYSDDCNVKNVVDLWPQAGVNQAFRLVVGNNAQFEYYIEAVGRSQCDYRWFSFPVSCTTSSPDHIDFWHETGADQRFRLHPVRMNNPHSMEPIADTGCADPYVWYSTTEKQYALQCTAGKLPLSYSPSIDPNTASFKYQGESLGGTLPSWASDNARWAPENIFVPETNENYCFYSDSSAQANGVHRMGWSMSKSGEKPNQWSTHSSSYMDLGNTAGGEIDGNVFVDEVDQKTYFIWKSDDNNVGSTTTRIWMQQIQLGNATVKQLTTPTVIMDSTGLWWVDSWVNSGSLVEGPEIIKTNGWYYLFFASGKYCQDSYAEGVARSKNIWGPYEKLSVPFLSTGLVGNSQNKKIIGPGHASFIQDQGDQWYAIFHGSLDTTCNRLPFGVEMTFGYSGWPIANFK
jgi:hypothetical protein